MDGITNWLRICLDCISWGMILGALAQVLPPLAALVALAWNCIQIYTWWKKRRDDNRR